MTSEVDAYLSALPPDQRAALTALRARLKALLPDHIECLSYAMPGFRLPGPKGKMVVGYAAFAKRLGLYPHSGTVIPRLDCTPAKRRNPASYSPLTVRSPTCSPTCSPRCSPTRSLNRSSAPARPNSALATASTDPLPFHLGPNIPAGGSTLATKATP